MTNKEYANQFQLLAKLMELHDENSYRIKSYTNAYRIIRGISSPVDDMDLAAVKQVKGIGDAIGQKIQELRQHGKMEMLEQYKAQTPLGIVQLLGIKGLGVKKIKLLWQELEIQSPGELLYACNENRLVTLKGFGAKTQSNIQKQLEYFFQSIDKFHYAKLETLAEDLVMDIQDVLGIEQVALTGKIRRLEPVLSAIAVLIGQLDIQALFEQNILTLVEQTEQGVVYHCKLPEQEVPVVICTCESAFFGYNLFRTTGPEPFLKQFFEQHFPEKIDWRHNNPANIANCTEADLFEKAQLPVIAPEIRDVAQILPYVQHKGHPALLEAHQIKGIIHAHSTWSDGANSLEELATYVRDQGYEYLGITDHSKAAFYANGLSPERVLQQMQEIDTLNASLAPFKIFKGIEADILYDGSLDYDDELLAKFDFVIASIHTTLRMDKHRATQRLLRAIQNPHTTILGHPTGRLLLSREGYPIDHKTVIDACATHQVIIEINANPLRLDLDHTWIPYALEQGVKISVNPDAHSLAGVHDVHYGVLAARKGLLTAKDCVNTLDTAAFEAVLVAKKQAN